MIDGKIVNVFPKTIDPALLGAIGLVLAAAGLVGFGVARWLAGYRGANTLGMLAAFAFTAALAYAGVEAAAAIMWVMLVGLFLVWIVTMFANG
jgi:hypothetical protein